MLKFLQATNITWSDSIATSVFENCLAIQCGNEMQEMLNTIYDYSSDHRFLIHPIKSITIVKSINKRNAEWIQETTENFTLGNNTMEFKFETTHLGLRRTTSEENKINVNDRISLAILSDQNRRTWHKWTQPKNIL